LDYSDIRIIGNIEMQSQGGSAMEQWMSTGYRPAAGEVSVLAGNAPLAQEKTEGGFAEKIAEKMGLVPAEMSLAEYKIYFQEKMEALYQHSSQRNVFWYVDITDAAYQRMQTDPAYEQKVLDYLGRQKAVNYGSHSPRFLYVHIEDSWEKCYGYSLGVQRDERYEKYAEAKRREAKARAKKARKKKLLKEYLERRARQKRLLDKFLEEQLAKRRREHIRLERMWCKEKQMNRAARAYEASQIMLNRREQPL